MLSTSIKYYIAKCSKKLLGNDKEVMSRFFRKYGVKIGGGCNIGCNILGPEPYLIEIGDNVTIAYEVKLITHDNSVSKVCNEKSDFYGKIIIGNDCFVGARSTVLYGVTLANRIIVAAGSVVTKSFLEEGIIIAGNPAKIIGTWDELAQKGEREAVSVRGLSYEQKKKLLLGGAPLIRR